jgi:hypothetical protein
VIAALPAASTPRTWNTFLAISRALRKAGLPDARVDVCASAARHRGPDCQRSRPATPRSPAVPLGVALNPGARAIRKLIQPRLRQPAPCSLGASGIVAMEFLSAIEARVPPVRVARLAGDRNQRIGTELTSARRQSRAANNLRQSRCCDHWAKNPMREAENPDIVVAPSMDHGTAGNLRWSLADSRMHLAPGGWSRQTTVRELPTSPLIAGAFREGIAYASWREVWR